MYRVPYAFLGVLFGFALQHVPSSLHRRQFDICRLSPSFSPEIAKGAIHSSDGATITIAGNSTFENNSAIADGGVVTIGHGGEGIP